MPTHFAININNIGLFSILKEFIVKCCITSWFLEIYNDTIDRCCNKLAKLLNNSSLFCFFIRSYVLGISIDRNKSLLFSPGALASSNGGIGNISSGFILYRSFKCSKCPLFLYCTSTCK